MSQGGLLEALLDELGVIVLVVVILGFGLAALSVIIGYIDIGPGDPLYGGYESMTESVNTSYALVGLVLGLGGFIVAVLYGMRGR